MMTATKGYFGNEYQKYRRPDTDIVPIQIIYVGLEAFYCNDDQNFLTEPSSRFQAQD